MDLKEIADEANQLENEIGLGTDDVLNKLTQELGEFNDAVQKFRGRYCRKMVEQSVVEGELGDLVLNLISICNRLGINPNDLPVFAENTLNKFKERKEIYKHPMCSEEEQQRIETIKEMKNHKYNVIYINGNNKNIGRTNDEKEAWDIVHKVPFGGCYEVRDENGDIRSEFIPF
jgi:NTP pyrophosphatase (non-canonical NTP hydrolase)